jgi:hypothetical protein
MEKWIEAPPISRVVATPIFFEVERAGREEYGDAGSVWYTEMEITYLLACLKRGTYSDNPRARLRRHMMILGPIGDGKSTGSKAFLRDYIGACDILSAPSDYIGPTYYSLESGTGWERARGTATGDRLGVPWLPRADFWYCSEFMDFLGHGPASKDKGEHLNRAFEEGDIVVALAKLVGIQSTDAQREIMERFKIVFDANEGILQYRTNASFIGCSRPLASSVRETMEESGLSSRVVPAAWNSNRIQARTTWWNGPGRVSSLQPSIRKFNEIAWLTNFEIVPYPPKDLIQIVQQVHDGPYRELEDDIGVPTSTLRTLRDYGRIAQLVTAAAVSRVVSKLTEGQYIEKLEYEDEDAKLACLLSENYISALFQKYNVEGGSEPKTTGDHDLLQSFIMEEPDKRKNGFTQRDLVSWLEQKGRRSRSTAYNHIHAMEKSGLVTRVAPRYLIAAHELLEELGLVPPSFEDPPHASP